MPHRPARSLVDESRLPTLGEILWLPLDEISRFSLGFLNLACATMLPDTLDLDMIACLKQLDLWARHVHHETAAESPPLPKRPWRLSELGGLLPCGDDGHGASARLRSALRPRLHQHQALHGLRGGVHSRSAHGQGRHLRQHAVLYAAIGRMLGYPIYLCEAKAHLFCRWATKGRPGAVQHRGQRARANTPDDDYYKTWPHEISEKEVYLGHFLRNLDPYEELAEFMAARGHCLLDRGTCLTPSSPIPMPIGSRRPIRTSFVLTGRAEHGNRPAGNPARCPAVTGRRRCLPAPIARS